jgi:hypothetical protein
MMAFAFIGLMRIMASPEKAVVARPAPASPSVHLRGASAGTITLQIELRSARVP